MIGGDDCGRLRGLSITLVAHAWGARGAAARSDSRGGAGSGKLARIQHGVGSLGDSLDQRPFFGRVESLRGICAMAVAAYHFSGMAVHGVILFAPAARDGPGLLDDGLRRLGLLLTPGRGALMTFFVVSGLVLRVSLQYGPQDVARAAARFHIARVFRIYPIVMACALATVLLLGWQVPDGPGQAAGPLSITTFLANLVLLDVSLNTTWWALQVEVLMAPLLVALYFVERRAGVRALVAIALATTALSFTKQWALWPPLSHNVFAFVLGMLVPTLGREAVARFSPAAARWSAAGSAVAIVVPHSLLGMFSQWSAVIEAYGAVVLVSIVAYRVDLRSLRFLDRRLVRLVGIASCSYYVLHPLAAPFAGTLTTLVLPPAWLAAAPSLVAFGVIAAWLLVMAPIALLGFHLVEAPGMALGRQINRAAAARWRTAPGAATAPTAADRASA
jgi:peptidoglycan/LPS O-acetylase OafA/YrhL